MLESRWKQNRNAVFFAEFKHSKCKDFKFKSSGFPNVCLLPFLKFRRGWEKVPRKMKIYFWLSPSKFKLHTRQSFIHPSGHGNQYFIQTPKFYILDWNKLLSWLVLFGSVSLPSATESDKFAHTHGRTSYFSNPKCRIGKPNNVAESRCLRKSWSLFHVATSLASAGDHAEPRP